MESHNSLQNEEMFNYSIVCAAGYRDISENLRFLMFAKLKKRKEMTENVQYFELQSSHITVYFAR